MIRKYPAISEKLPVFMHGADYNPDQWLLDPKIMTEDIRLMKLAHCNVISVGIFSWSSLEPEEGKFNFDWLDHVLNTFYENGIYAWLATPSGARPAWLSAKYPEVLRVAENRVRNLHGHRHNHCYTSPVYREKVKIINQKLAERYSFHPSVIGWHVSNEYGGECHCDLCQNAFRDWLQSKYKTLDALNIAWWTSFWSHTFTDWSQIESPAAHGETMVHGLNLAWKRFITDQTVNFCSHEIEPLRSVNPELPITTNFMEAYEGLNYRKFADILDVISWDSYPTWHDEQDPARLAAWFSLNHDFFRSIKNGKPFILMESTPSATNWQEVSKLKRPGMHILSSIQAVAHGSDSVQYFQWRKSRGSSEKFHGAVVDHCGHENTRVFREVSELGVILGNLEEVLGSSVEAETAIIFDWENRWAVKDAQGPRNKGINYESTIMDHYLPFWSQGVPVDIIGMDDDLSKYKLLIAPMLYMVKEGIGEKIEKFIAEGGTLITTYWSGIVDENDLCYLGGFPGPLRKVLGIWSEEIDSLHDTDINEVEFRGNNSLNLSGKYQAIELCDLIHLEGAESLAVYKQDFYKGMPAVTKNQFGKGNAFYIATRLKEPFYSDFYTDLINQLEISKAIDTSLPKGVTALCRTDGNMDYVFILNFSGAEQKIRLDHSSYIDLITNERVSSVIEMKINGVVILKRQRS